MNIGYENDMIWRQIQEYLPVKNRIDDNNVPKEEWLETGKKQIHIFRLLFIHDTVGLWRLFEHTVSIKGITDGTF